MKKILFLINKLNMFLYINHDPSKRLNNNRQYKQIIEQNIKFY